MEQSTTSEEIRQITRQIPGSWQLPINDQESITITFFPNSHFFWTASAYSTTKKAIQILTGPEMKGNWHVRLERRVKSRGKKVSIFSTSNDKKVSTSNTPGSHGPYLILNFTGLPESVLNFNLFGFRADVANWFNNILEVTRDPHYRILEFSENKMRLETPEKKVEVWHKTNSLFS